MQQDNATCRADGRPQADARRLLLEYASWARSIEWRYYMTATFDRNVTRDGAWELLRRYLDEIERTKRHPVSALIAMESKWSGLGKPGSGYHFHMLFRAPVQFTASYLKELWETKRYGGRWCSQMSQKECLCKRCEGGSMRCCPYDSSGRAADYLFKELHIEPDN